MCIFCSIINHEIPSRVIYEDENVLSILDINPLSKGHTLVMPKKHVTDILDTDQETLDQVMHVTQKLAVEIMKKTNADGCNIVSNCKEAAGQSVDHLHFHIIPRYTGDTAISFHPLTETPDLEEIEKLLKD
ncbi:MAG: HIT family protein [Solobacterium sp.]|nr:HIT family protein [Solobacterium sp.]